MEGGFIPDVQSRRADGVAPVELCRRVPSWAAISLLALLLASPLLSLERVTTRDGRQLIGTATIEDLRVTTVTGVVVLPRVSLHELRFADSTATITTKDSRTVTGQLELEELLLATDVQTHALPWDQIEQIDFDAFVDVATLPTGRHLSCPVRLTLPADKLLLAGKGHSTAASKIRCGESYVISFELTTRKSKRTNSLGERIRGRDITLRPYVLFGEGHDYFARLEFALLDGHRSLGGDTVTGVFDEGEGARPGPFRFWVADEAIEGAEDLKLRMQFLLVDEREDRDRGSPYWWFTQKGAW